MTEFDGPSEDEILEELDRDVEKYLNNRTYEEELIEDQALFYGTTDPRERVKLILDLQKKTEDRDISEARKKAIDDFFDWAMDQLTEEELRMTDEEEGK